MTHDQQIVTLNFSVLHENLMRGVSRSAVMLGIGTNAADHRPHISHLIAQEGAFHTQLLPEDINHETREHLAEEFGKWVRANGLRELLESFSIFLHAIYEMLFIVRCHVAGEPRPGLMTPERFERRGIADQIEQLSKIILIEEKTKDCLASLNQARNCYAHRQGRVGQVDLTGDECVIRWRRVSVTIREPDGTVIPEDKVGGHFLPAGSPIQIAFVEQMRSFRIGDELLLSRQDLQEICLYVLKMGELLGMRAQEMTIAEGIPVGPLP